MEQLTGSWLRKEYNKAIYCHPVYLTYTEITPCEMLGWMNYKLETVLLREVSTISDNQIYQAPSIQKVLDSCHVMCHVLSCVQFFVTHGLYPLYMGCSRQEYWSGLLFLSPGDLLHQVIKSLSPALQEDSLPTESWGKPF